MYQPFIGRKEELSALEKLYETEGFQMMVVYGRRRIGKSTLLSHFIRGKKAIFYTAARNGLQRNLQLLSRRVLDVLAPDLNTLTFSTYEELFAFLSNKCREERILLSSMNSLILQNKLQNYYLYYKNISTPNGCKEICI